MAGWWKRGGEGGEEEEVKPGKEWRDEGEARSKRPGGKRIQGQRRENMQAEEWGDVKLRKVKKRSAEQIKGKQSKEKSEGREERAASRNTLCALNNVKEVKAYAGLNRGQRGSKYICQ